MKSVSALAALLLISGCSLAQDVYDNAAEAQCSEITDARARLDCEAAARDTVSERRRAEREEKSPR